MDKKRHVGASLATPSTASKTFPYTPTRNPFPPISIMKPRIYIGIIILFLTLVALAGNTTLFGEKINGLPSIGDYLNAPKKHFVKPVIPAFNLPTRIGAILMPDAA